MSVTVIGGGLAGGAAACALASAGQSVTLFERERSPGHKICGEFISREAQLYLGRLGLDLEALGARPIRSVRLIRGGEVAEARLPFTALSLTRRTLDDALLARASECGAEVRRGETVSDIGQVAGSSVFLATGKHDLRGARRRLVVAPEDLVGFKMYFELAPKQRQALEGAVEVVLFSDSYAGLQMVEGGRANLCLLANRMRLGRAGSTWDGLLADLFTASPHLRRRLDGAIPQLARPLTIARVPYGFIHRPTKADPPSLFRLGDQIGVIPSFSGDGMSIALHSAQAAAAALLAGATAASYHRQMRWDLRGQMLVAQALYRIGRSRIGQAGMMAAMRLWPGGLAQLARLTRVPEAALRRVVAT